LVLCGLVLGLIGGASVASLLAVVNSGLYAGSGDVGSLVASFAGLCVLIVIGSVGSDISANVVGQRIIASLRKSLAAKILMAPIDQLESYRAHQLIPVLTKDGNQPVSAIGLQLIDWRHQDLGGQRLAQRGDDALADNIGADVRADRSDHDQDAEAGKRCDQATDIAGAGIEPAVHHREQAGDAGAADEAEHEAAENQ